MGTFLPFSRYMFSLSLHPLEYFISAVASEVCKNARLYLGFYEEKTN